MPDATRICEDLRALLGPSRVADDDATLARASHDTWVVSVWRSLRGDAGARPACVVRPETTAEIAAVVSYAARERVPVVPFGLGSGVCGAVLAPAGAVVVDLGAMQALLRLDDQSLLATVQPGMRGSDFEARLNEAGMSMGHFPQSIALSSVGGWVATRAAGQFSTRYGNIEDMLVAFEAVLPTGSIIRTRPIPRASTGPDLRHLFLGAEGTTGVLTELTFQVHPLPETSRRLAVVLPSMTAGLEALRLIVRAGWRPPVLRLYDEIEAGRTFADAVSPGQSLLLALSEGPAALTDAEITAVEDVGRRTGGTPIGPRPVESWLEHRNVVPTFESFLKQGVIVDTIEVATTWDRIDEMYAGVLARVRQVPGLIVASGHSSHSYPTGTNIYFTFAARPESPEGMEELYFRIWSAAMEATLAAGGTISHHHGIGRVRRDWLARELGPAYAVLAAVKRALDPHGIMNPGTLLPEGIVPGKETAPLR
jgi:alkyldihydroxyacetonephosphate synthase